MVKPTIAVDIIARDKTAAGQRAAERRFGKFVERRRGLNRTNGLSLFSDTKGLAQAERFATGLGSAAMRMNGSVAGLSGAAGILGTVVRAAGPVGAVVAGAGAAAGGVYAHGNRWAKMGAEVGRVSRSLGVNTAFLQSARAANERFGVSAEETTASIEGLGSTLYDAQYGANNQALGVLTQIGVKLKRNKDGAIDVASAYDDIADAIARQKDPQVQRRLAETFGMGSALPALREGSKALKVERSDYAALGGGMSEQEVAKATAAARSATRLGQGALAVEKKVGVRSMGAQRSMADGAVTFLRDPGAAISRAFQGARRAAAAPAASVSKGFDAFARRIEHQESRGRQFDKYGRPLTSSTGAVGVMQVMPGTGPEAAQAAGLKWDARRWQHDEAYNRAIGKAYLKKQYDRFGGDEVLAAAAYNAGAGRVSGWLRRFGDPRKGEISYDDFVSRMTESGRGFSETQDYVKKTAQTPAVQPRAMAAAPPAKAQVEITLRNAPAGTMARVSGGQGVDVNMNVRRSLEGAG